MKDREFNKVFQKEVETIFQNEAVIKRILGLEGADEALTLETHSAYARAEFEKSQQTSGNGADAHFKRFAVSLVKENGYFVVLNRYPWLPFWVWSARFDAYQIEREAFPADLSCPVKKN